MSVPCFLPPSWGLWPVGLLVQYQHLSLLMHLRVTWVHFLVWAELIHGIAVSWKSGGGSVEAAWLSHTCGDGWLWADGGWPRLRQQSSSWCGLWPFSRPACPYLCSSCALRKNRPWLGTGTSPRCCTVSAETGHRISPDPREREIGPISPWEALKSHCKERRSGVGWGTKNRSRSCNKFTSSSPSPIGGIELVSWVLNPINLPGDCLQKLPSVAFLFASWNGFGF